MKIWLYYAKSGGGHKAPAEALARDLKKNFPEIETKFIDLAEEASIFFRGAIESGYVLLSHHLPWLYAFIYSINNSNFVIKVECFLADIFVKPSIKARLVVDSPDAVVATHFLISPLKAALRDLKKQIPIFVLVTDPYSVSPIWFVNKELNYIVYSDVAKQIAIKCGVPSGNIHVFRQIINHDLPVLSNEQIKGVKLKYGIDPLKKMVLIIGGANGLPKGEKIFDAVLKEKINCETVAVLGTNKKQEKNFLNISKINGNSGKVLGWVDNLIDLIAVSDLVITKAGAGVVWESLLLKKPLLIVHHIFGQEKGNMEYVVKNGFGWYLKKPPEIVKKIHEVVEGNLGEEAAKKIESFGLAVGNNDVANYIYRTLTEQKP
jgi:processive 1,2-diacylglycerol beta-glucosyltransferase/1,2-diacylglycerol 3-beta-galactosyltransferase